MTQCKTLLIKVWLGSKVEILTLVIILKQEHENIGSSAKREYITIINVRNNGLRIVACCQQACCQR